jgi:hypothetical protein
MPTNSPIPTIEEVQRIINIDDPVIRNLQITQCYHELSGALARRTGQAANWCTFATWASKQAGQTIRKEDLSRMLERRLRNSPSTMEAVDSLAAAANLEGETLIDDPQDLALRPHNFQAAIDRASEAVGRGNKKVFEEIGREFARFYDNCLLDQAFEREKITRFCEELLPGEPPEGQSYLRQAFMHYYQTLFEDDGKTRAELILQANIEIGFHEQTRLQPEIVESLDAGLISFSQFSRPFFTSIFPMSGWLKLAHLNLRRMLGRPTALDLAIQDLISAARAHLRQAITELMMTISLPSGVRLSLREDLSIGFPETLRQIANQDLKLLLEKLDPTPDSPIDSGALDWADLSERLHYILDLFRCYQENRDLFAPPFSPEQVEALKSGRLPVGRL